MDYDDRSDDELTGVAATREIYATFGYPPSQPLPRSRRHVCAVVGGATVLSAILVLVAGHSYDPTTAFATLPHALRAATCASSSNVPPPTIRRKADSKPKHWSRGAAADPCMMHDVIIATTHKTNLDAQLRSVSDPSSKNYRKYLSTEAVNELAIDQKHVRNIATWVQQIGAQEIKRTRNGEYITARASVATWTQALGCEFFDYSYDGKKAPRCEGAYGLPVHVDASIHAVFNVGNLAPRISKLKGITKLVDKEVTEYVTPSVLAAFYSIPSSGAATAGAFGPDILIPPTGSASARQAVFETQGEYYSPTDLAQFRSYFGLPPSEATPISNVGSHDEAIACDVDADLCDEGNLDMQYLTTVNPYGPTTYFYVTLADVATDPFLAFAMALADLVEPIYVASISWGSIESEEVPSIMASFDVEAAKLGLKGGTIVVSSGDDGANGLGTECGYAPSFPASSPNVLAVGATNAYDWSGTAGAPNEIVCQADVLGGVVTSGGGFSGTYAQPYWQADAVASYFAQVDGTQQQPFGGFAKGGRGYPDVALAGKDFEVVIGDVLYLVSGTSASAPSVAGMLARINAGLLAAGKAPVGLVNPTLYASSGSFANDIIDGDNTCTAYLLECEQGFYATTGWDPASGWGSVDYGRLEALLA